MPGVDASNIMLHWMPKCDQSFEVRTKRPVLDRGWSRNATTCSGKVAACILIWNFAISSEDCLGSLRTDQTEKIESKKMPFRANYRLHRTRMNTVEPANGAEVSRWSAVGKSEFLFFTANLSSADQLLTSALASRLLLTGTKWERSAEKWGDDQKLITTFFFRLQWQVLRHVLLSVRCFDSPL